MLVPLCVRCYLLHLGCGDVARKYSADTHAFAVDLEHDLRGLFERHAEESLEDEDHKLHRRVVVVEKHDLEQGRRLEPGLFGLK